jgi:hypothetical protein
VHATARKQTSAADAANSWKFGHRCASATQPGIRNAKFDLAYRNDAPCYL